MDFLDVDDKKNIDISKYYQAGAIEPGHYELNVYVNGQVLSTDENTINYTENSDDKAEKKTAQPCIKKKSIEKIGFKPEIIEKIEYYHVQCANISFLKGVNFETDLHKRNLNIIIPDKYLEYTTESWLPKSRWDNGISGFMFDYNINANTVTLKKAHQNSNLSYFGIIGQNIGKWRIRADYQGSNIKRQGKNESDFSWNRLHAFLPMPKYNAKISVGENVTNSSIFSSWTYTGVSVESDDRMLPPNLRGYAPEITGFANTQAQVKVSHLGTIIYDKTVQPGYFEIKDLQTSLRGKLNVEIIEQNGNIKKYDIDTNSTPYLSRAGQFRYKISGGDSRTRNSKTIASKFISGEYSKGINNQWSLIGGSVFSDRYSNFALGFGKNLNQFGAISLDLSRSEEGAKADSSRIKGYRLHLDYSRSFNEYASELGMSASKVTSGNYINMNQHLNDNRDKKANKGSNDTYSLYINKTFPERDISTGLQISKQINSRYSSNYASINVSARKNLFSFKNTTLGISLSRSEYKDRKDNFINLRLSLPLYNGFSNFNSTLTNNRITNNIGYTRNMGNDSYSVVSGASGNGSNQSNKQISAIYNHNNEIARFSGNVFLSNQNDSSIGMNISGGGTLTAKGAALHSNNMNGGSRIIIDGNGEKNIRLNNGRTSTNYFGIGVIGDVPGYFKTTNVVDLNSILDDLEIENPVIETVLTEGAIGYKKLDILKGEKIFVAIRLKDGTSPPFLSTVYDDSGHELGIVTENGQAWLKGIRPNINLTVKWDGKVKCNSFAPNELNHKTYLLPCN